MGLFAARPACSTPSTRTFSDLAGSEGPFAFSFLGGLTVSLVFAVIEVVVTTLMFALFAFMYNLGTVTGGVSVTSSGGLRLPHARAPAIRYPWHLGPIAQPG